MERLTSGFGYIYKTTNLVNGKIYIGMHKHTCFDTKYIGSGLFLKEAIKKYGRKNFVCELVCWAKDIEDLKQKEIYYIDKFKSRNLKIGYNLHRGGYGGSDKGRKPETLKKMSIALKGRKAWNKGKHWSNDIKEKLSKAHIGKKGVSGTTGMKLSAETKLKMSIAHLGKKHTEETKKKMSDKMKGRKFTKEHCEKISKSNKERYMKLKCEETKNEK